MAKIAPITAWPGNAKAKSSVVNLNGAFIVSITIVSATDSLILMTNGDRYRCLTSAIAAFITAVNL